MYSCTVYYKTTNTCIHLLSLKARITHISVANEFPYFRPTLIWSLQPCKHQYNILHSVPPNCFYIVLTFDQSMDRFLYDKASSKTIIPLSLQTDRLSEEFLALMCFSTSYHSTTIIANSPNTQTFLHVFLLWYNHYKSIHSVLVFFAIISLFICNIIIHI